MEGNLTASMTQLPANVLEAFIPGFSIISGFLLDVLGFDITVVVSVGLLIFGLFASLKFLGHYTYAVFRDYFTSFVSINSTDEIYDQIMEWLDDQKISTNSRRLMATTGKRSAWDLPDLDTVAEEPDPKTLINFRNWDSDVSPKFLFYFGRHIFVHNNRYFEFDRSNNVFTDRVLRKVESIRFTCVGLSSQPIKDLLKECRDHYLNKGTTVTVVYRPVAKEDRGTTCHMWNKVATRPSRPIDTVILNQNEKMRVLKDMNEYLHPTAMKWYANRGIPYRRGYLFHGPPGTGKSSFGWAIAGVFGLDIYCISLADPTLTEDHLGIMFISLPRRCILLLEDIDSAGLVKRQEEGGKGKDNNGISLSGLLNAIDGVASPEGRVLVMTTNCPEKLDEALIRPGRIDIKIQFTMATRSQISQLFACMYSPDNPSSPTITFNKELPNPKHVDDLASGKFATLQSGVDKLTPADLAYMGEAFANKLPDSKFTLAELQGYLLTRRWNLWRALEEVEELVGGAECRAVPCEIDSSTEVHGVEPLSCLDS